MSTNGEEKVKVGFLPPALEARYRTLLRKRFPKGSRVEMTAKAKRSFPYRKSYVGAVIGYGQYGDMLSVRRDGLKTASTFHPSFWTRLPRKDKK